MLPSAPGVAEYIPHLPARFPLRASLGSIRSPKLLPACYSWGTASAWKA